MCPLKFFNIQPNTGETVGKKSKLLKGSYQIESCCLVYPEEIPRSLNGKLRASLGATYVPKIYYVVCSGVATFCPIFGSVPASSRSILGRWRKITYNPPAIPNRIYGNG